MGARRGQNSNPEYRGSEASTIPVNYPTILNITAVDAVTWYTCRVLSELTLYPIFCELHHLLVSCTLPETNHKILSE